MPRAWPSKYASLNRYLEQLPAGQVAVRLTFAEMERLTGAPVPATARVTPRYWTTSVIAEKNWLGCGFSGRLDRLGQAVEFTRVPWP